MPENQSDVDFERLIGTHRAQLHGFALSLVANKDDAEDLVQQACVILWEKRAQFSPGTNFMAWARKICRFQALNLWRKTKNRRSEPLLDEHLAQIVDDRAEQREQEFIRHRQALKTCIDFLPDRQRKAVRAHYYEDLSIPEIASELGINENAVSQLLFRARSGLINCVQTRSLKSSEETES